MKEAVLKWAQAKLLGFEYQRTDFQVSQTNVHSWHLPIALWWAKGRGILKGRKPRLRYRNKNK